MLDYPLAVFIDTNIFIGCRYDISINSVLSNLKKFSEEEKVKIYLSEVAIGEIKKHILKDTRKAYKIFKKARREANKCISSSLVEDTNIKKFFKLLPDENTIIEAAITNFQEFLNSNNIIRLNNSGVNIDSIFDDYFKSNPPFENLKNKKNEFPDAFMISKLKNVFSKEKPVFIITGDKGFKLAFKDTTGFTCLNSLNELFDLINSQDEMYSKINQLFLQPKVKEYISEKIKYEIEEDGVFIDGLDCDRKGCCDGYDYDLTDLESISEVKYKLESINDIQDDIINVSLLCNVKIDAICYYEDYENSIWDNEEKEYLYINEVKVEESHDAEFTTDLVLSVTEFEGEITYEIIDILYDLTFDEMTRIERNIFNKKDLIGYADYAKEQKMEALLGLYD